jgi:outer membrane lipoprotein SlyB
MMKKLLAMFALAVAMTGNAYAATETSSGTDLMAATQVQAVQAGVVSAVDMQAAFQQDAQPMQMAALSGQEMRATEGAFWGWVVSFIVTSIVGYVAAQNAMSAPPTPTSPYSPGMGKRGLNMLLCCRRGNS